MNLGINIVFGIFFVNRKKVDNDYNALQERLSTLPDKLSYNIMVCLMCFF